ncbi:hypothetical protein Tco_0848475 [Tanacetum coccineum]
MPRHLSPPPSDDENEFSCTATPQNQNKLHYHLDANDVIVKALEILKNATASPALSRFGKSPVVKELRITDSPFALNNGDEDGDQVDEAAEKFIMRSDPQTDVAMLSRLPYATPSNHLLNYWCLLRFAPLLAELSSNTIVRVYYSSLSFRVFVALVLQRQGLTHMNAGCGTGCT